MRLFLFYITGFCLLALSSCSNQDAINTTTKTEAFDKSGIDSTIKPGDNFFLYANGAWMKKVVIPDDQSGWGSFYTLYDDNQKNLRGLLEEAAKSAAAKGSLEQKTGDYYASGMDTVAIEGRGAEPLKPLLAKFDSVKDYKQLMNLLAEGGATGQDDLLGFYVGADEKNSSVNIPVFSQTGLSLPEKEYYTKQDSATKAARTAFVNFATRLFILTGTDSVTASKNAAMVLGLETELAKSHRTPAETRDPQRNYNNMSVTDLQKSQPNINWQNYFSKMGVQPDSVDVQQPGYYVALNSLLASQPIDAWKTKVKFDYIAGNANRLSKSFRDAAFNFNRIFSGQKVQSERWKSITGNVDRGLGELLGQLYVKKYFTDSAKHRMDELVNNLQKAFEGRIHKLDWMSDSTKTQAIVKLHAFMKKIGFPSKWKTYDDVTIDKGTYFENAMAVRMHNRKEMLRKIGKPVDKTEWDMSPPTVNAYYNPTNNEIVFPAGILQFPFFNAAADDAVNYGAIGMVIGHEMTHGFDDQGAQYDEKGNMKNWWGQQDLTNFKAKTTAVVNQYNGYKMFDSLHVKGDLTLGENLADIGGLAIAYDAFKMTKQGQGAEKIDGFTPDQRFFLGYAQVWRLKDRDENMRVRLNTDPHSPEMFRVNGPASNFDPFYAAFNVKEGDKMYIKPADRAHIW